MYRAQPVLWALGLFAAAPALAQDAVHTAPGDMTGRAGAAHAHDNLAITANPAALGLSRRYALGAQGGFWNGRDFRFGANAVDSLTNPGIALGLAYERSYITSDLPDDEQPGWIVSGDDPPSRRRFDHITAAFALPLLDNRLSFGVSGTLLLMNHAVLGTRTSGDVEAGIAGRPAERWSLGLAVRNILPRMLVTDTGVGLVAGTRYAWDEHTALALDVDVPLTKVDEGLPMSVRLGGEWGDTTKHFGAGYRFEGPTGQHWVSVGAGLWSDPATSPDGGSKAGFVYAAQVPLHDLSGTGVGRLAAIQHTLSLIVQPQVDRDRR
jgi:hypothetical protein